MPELGVEMAVPVASGVVSSWAVELRVRRAGLALAGVARRFFLMFRRATIFCPASCCTKSLSPPPRGFSHTTPSTIYLSKLGDPPWRLYLVCTVLFIGLFTVIACADANSDRHQ